MAGPRQNRIDPWGELFADRSRGALMGNRGLLHDEHGRIRRPYQLKRWIICLLEFKGRRRQVMRPGHYTELFFWDEATALAAGHRPCAECQRERYRLFGDSWKAGNPGRVGVDERLLAERLDLALHAERLDADGAKVTFTAAPGNLPDGTFVAEASAAERSQPYLVHGGRLWPWRSTGYGKAIALDELGRAQVLTPRSTVAALDHGYPVDVRLHA